eukprot:1267741-Alexandrium_andersonii.AAC.1
MPACVGSRLVCRAPLPRGLQGTGDCRLAVPPRWPSGLASAPPPPRGLPPASVRGAIAPARPCGRRAP